MRGKISYFCVLIIGVKNYCGQKIATEQDGGGVMLSIQLVMVIYGDND